MSKEQNLDLTVLSDKQLQTLWSHHSQKATDHLNIAIAITQERSRRRKHAALRHKRLTDNN